MMTIVFFRRELKPASAIESLAYRPVVIVNDTALHLPRASRHHGIYNVA